MLWTRLVHDDVTSAITSNRSGDAFTSLLTVHRKRKMNEAYSETYRCTTRFTLVSQAPDNHALTEPEYERTCFVHVLWIAMNSGELG